MKPRSSKRLFCAGDCSTQNPNAGAITVGAGLPAKHPARWMAPALPVFAAKAAPTGDRGKFHFKRFSSCLLSGWR
ncbi:hypothetical protein FCH83_13630 [Pseudomonas putida]|nr:hypothetical protein [Pseudomonas putida]NTZ00669.1 hypothetical protein [Pseudomonas putida]NTZ22995.1 hypothetical protein [Pseudomonas putida]NTZ55772.1 hypothetical protein [Pseudomonas putida]NTZ65377.1 hypothetical protein [Pseudomonas putida]